MVDQDMEHARSLTSEEEASSDLSAGAVVVLGLLGKPLPLPLKFVCIRLGGGFSDRQSACRRLLFVVGLSPDSGALQQVDCWSKTEPDSATASPGQTVAPGAEVISRNFADHFPRASEVLHCSAYAYDFRPDPVEEQAPQPKSTGVSLKHLKKQAQAAAKSKGHG